MSHSVRDIRVLRNSDLKGPYHTQIRYPPLPRGISTGAANQALQMDPHAASPSSHAARLRHVRTSMPVSPAKCYK